MPGPLFQGRAARLGFDPAKALQHVVKAEPRLACWIKKLGAFELAVQHLQSPFEALTEAVVFQQLHGKAAQAILARLQGLFGDRFPSPQELAACPDEALRGCGLSRGKIASLRDLAGRTLDGTVPALRALRRMKDDAILERLTRVRGIGRWTVEMLLIFRLGRPDVWPATDFGIRKGLTRVLGRRTLLDPKRAQRFGDRLRPYRTVAAWYLWRVAESPDARPDPATRKR